MSQKTTIGHHACSILSDSQIDLEYHKIVETTRNWILAEAVKNQYGCESLQEQKCSSLLSCKSLSMLYDEDYDQDDVDETSDYVICATAIA